MEWTNNLQFGYNAILGNYRKLLRKFSYLCTTKITKIMQKDVQDKKDRIALLMAQVLIWSGIIAFFVALLMPPMGKVDNSVLAYIGEAFALGGSILLGYKWMKGSINQLCIQNNLKNPISDENPDR